jgi:hypothetical protein
MIASSTVTTTARMQFRTRRLPFENRFCVLLALVFAATMPNAASATIFYTPFGPSGEGGTVNGQVLSFGSGGEVFELDAFLNIGGTDLNGATLGTSAQLSVNPLPAGLAYSFSTELSPDETDLTLRYEFTNNTGGTLLDVWFFSFVDAEIDVAINDYFNEAGFQFGSPGAGPGDPDADAWEIDEPGYVFGDIFSNLLSGSLDNTNAVPLGSPDDASLAIGFALGDLPAAGVATIDVMLSEEGNTIGSLGLQHFDTGEGSFDTLTLSGAAVVVPEPDAWFLAVVGVTIATAAVRNHVRNRKRRSFSHLGA